ncbi:aminoglycoside phosphotransferase family protein [candidate division KSB1 bacterium]|nr:aminoglycoside phosphotransferase family protein [candidate division KSB1 bacterium]
MFADHKTETSSLPALNPAWLQQYLPNYLWREHEAPQEILAIQILQVWWEEKRTTILYQFRFGSHTGDEREHLYVGYLVSAERLAEEYKAALKKARTQPVAGRAAAVVAEANLVLLAFPNDRKLHLFSEPELQRWLKDKWRQALRALPKRGRLKKWKVKAARYEVLRYVPGKRFTMRCRVLIQRKDGTAKEVSAIAKQLSDGKKAQKLFSSLVALQAAWASFKSVTPARLRALHKIPMPVRFPRPLAWDRERALVFLEDLPGKNLEQALSEVDLAQTFHAVGEMLSAFHGAPRRVRKRVSRAGEIKETRRAMREIAEALPAFRTRLLNLLRELKTQAGRDETPEVLLHGTFRLNHIFIHEGELALLDLDSMRLGHPAYDLANFLSALYYFEAQSRLTQAQREEITFAFLRGYAAKTAQHIAPATLLWFLISLLINKQASKYLSHHHPDREEKLAHLLALAEAIAALCRNLPAETTLATMGALLPPIARNSNSSLEG